jgi:hypothetical protein
MDAVPKVGVSAALKAVPAVVAVAVSKVLRVVLIRIEEVAPLPIPEIVTGMMSPLGVPSVTVPDPAVISPNQVKLAL